MPVEIKELIIRAVSDQGTGQSESNESRPRVSSETAMIEACVKQVLRILKKEKER